MGQEFDYAIRLHNRNAICPLGYILHAQATKQLTCGSCSHAAQTEALSSPGRITLAAGLPFPVSLHHERRQFAPKIVRPSLASLNGSRELNLCLKGKVRPRGVTSRCIKKIALTR
jgi:hypothetical protein